MGKAESKVAIGLKRERKPWDKPELIDVTGKIMAQPFIRFT